MRTLLLVFVLLAGCGAAADIVRVGGAVTCWGCRKLQEMGLCEADAGAADSQ